MLFDAHCDTISKLYDQKKSLSQNDLHIDFSKMKNFGGVIQVFALWLDDFFAYNMPLKKTLILIDKYYREIEKNGITHIENKKELDNIIAANGIGSMLAVEGGEAIEGNIEYLRILYKLGVRLMTLSWNRRNQIADGLDEKDSKNGLSNFGRQVVAEMNRLGMVIDLSHSNETTFYDVMELTAAPVVASHSNAFSICPHKRNLTDEQIKALIKNEGVAGINLCADFISEKNAQISDVIAHIEHFMELGASKNIGFGADFDGVDTLPEGIGGIQDMHKIINELLKLNYPQEMVDGILYKNFVDLFENIL